MREGSELPLASASATAFATPLAYESPAKPAVEERYITLDAYRGAMIALVVSGGFGLAPLVFHPSDVHIPTWFNHAAWEGVLLWDLVLPAFLFMAGVALAYALARRRASGTSSPQLYRHVASRSVMLILLSQVLDWMATGKLQFQLHHALSQIALAYFFAFLILQLKFRWQAVAAALILAGDWALFALFPGPGGAYSRTGNIAAVIDRVVFGRNYADGYVTISFIGATVTTLFGAWTGALLRTQRAATEKAKILAVAGVAGLAGGKAFSLFNPMIKRLWTPSFTLYSAGWVLLMMLLFVLMIDVWGCKRCAFPLAVVGMNSLLVYSLAAGLGAWIDRSLGVSTGQFRHESPTFLVAGSCTFLCLVWFLCYTLYRRKICVKI
jgi:predicted acyltransferase